MKSGWTTRALNDVCLFSSGLWKGKKPPFVKVGVIRSTNFDSDGTLDFADIAYLDVEVGQFEKRRLRPGDVVLEKSGGGPNQPVGRVALFDRPSGDFSHSNFTAAVRVRFPNELDYRFLHMFLYWTHLSGATEAIQSHSTGIRNLNGDAYKAIPFAFPSLPEQRRIIRILDRGFANIAAASSNAEQNLLNARDLVDTGTESFFQPKNEPTFSGGSLEDLCDLIVDCEHRTAPTQSHGIPSIRTPNIGRGRLILDDVRRVSEATYREWTRRAEPRAGDLILAREAPAGNVAVIPEDLRVCLGQRTVLIRPNRSVVEPAYLAHLLLLRDSRKLLLSHERGATVQHVNVKDIKAFKVAALPPLEDQRAVVGRTNDLLKQGDCLIANTVRKVAALDELKRSLLREAFAGAL